MSTIQEKLRARRRHEVVLRSGLKVGFHYPNVEEMITKVGNVPLPALAKAASAFGTEPPTEEEATKIALEHPDEMAVGLRYTRLMVAEMLDDIDGEDISTEDDRGAIVDLLEPEDRQTLFLLASRQLDLDSFMNEATPGEA